MQAGKTAEAPETTASSPSHSQKILDFSFLEVADVSELVDKLDIAIDAKEKDADKTGKQRVLKVQSIRLSNNQLATVNGLAPALDKFVYSAPERLRWVDLSFNALTSIRAAFVDFKELSVLYLHANKISKFGEIKPLSELSKLRSLTLHGNPIEDKKHYRTWVIHTIPTLNQLDFSPITRQDREGAKTWSTIFRKKLSGETDADEY